MRLVEFGYLGVAGERVDEANGADQDLQKVDAFKAGDRSAFAFLFQKYRKRIFGLIFRMVGNREDALDLTQVTFLNVLKALPRFENRGTFYTWVYRIATNVTIDFLRNRAKAPRPLEQELIEGDEWLGAMWHEPSPASGLLEEEFNEHLSRAIADLPHALRITFLLHTGERLSYREIADILCCPVGTIMSRLFHAREKLREALLPYITT